MRIILILLSFCSSMFWGQSVASTPINIGLSFDYQDSFFLESHKDLDDISRCEKALLQDIQQSINCNFKPVYYSSKQNLLQDLQQGKIDMAIGDINLSSQMINQFYASHPYNICRNVLMGHEQEKNNYFLILFKSIFTKDILNVLFLFLIITLIFAHSIWFFEHKKQGILGYKNSYQQFFAESFWIAFNTNGKMNIGSPLPMRASWINRFFSFFIWLFTSVCVAFVVYNINIELAKNSSYNEVSNLSDLKPEHEVLVLKNNPELLSLAQKSQAKTRLVDDFDMLFNLLAKNPKAYVLIKENNLDFFNWKKPQNMELKSCSPPVGINKLVILYRTDFYLNNFSKIVNPIDSDIEMHIENDNFSQFFKP